ncbi:hypothetical protein BaRGS_00018534 [Batillaria attramentaria]|uniref:Uncharacterized protein n=1 Tax=Batillaria attramentaria TaxID=370345 RepID=A0ABD0KSH6_9CAEN
MSERHQPFTTHDICRAWYSYTERWCLIANKHLMHRFTVCESVRYRATVLYVLDRRVVNNSTQRLLLLATAVSLSRFSPQHASLLRDSPLNSGHATGDMLALSAELFSLLHCRGFVQRNCGPDTQAVRPVSLF